MGRGFKDNDGKFHPTEKKHTSALSSSDLKGTTGFNVKLKKNEVIQNPKHVTLSNGRKAIRGVGSDGTPIFRFVKG